MAILLSLLTASLYGVGDFLGGLSARRAPIIQIIVGAHALGFFGALAASLLLADAFTWQDLAIGAAAGVFGGLGLALLYRGLAVGPMSVIAPITAISAAAVPAFWDVLTGGRLSPLAWIGVAVAVLAIGLVSTGSDDAASSIHPDFPATAQAAASAVSGRAVAEALASGASFGILFILFAAADPATAPWPSVGARIATVIPLATYLFVKKPRSQLVLDRTTILLIAGAGIMDTASNVFFIFAAKHGQLTTVSVLVALYPVATIIMAWIFLSERIASVQRVGLGLTLGAIALIAAG